MNILGKLVVALAILMSRPSFAAAPTVFTPTDQSGNILGQVGGAQTSGLSRSWVYLGGGPSAYPHIFGTGIATDLWLSGCALPGCGLVLGLPTDRVGVFAPAATGYAWDYQGGAAAAGVDGKDVRWLAQNGGQGNQRGGNVQLYAGVGTGTQVNVAEIGLHAQQVNMYSLVGGLMAQFTTSCSFVGACEKPVFQAGGGTLVKYYAANNVGTLGTLMIGVTGSPASVVNMPSLTTGTPSNFVCMDASGNLIIQSTACMVSSERFKAVFDHGSTSIGGFWDVMRIHPVEFTMRVQAAVDAEGIVRPAADHNYYNVQMGLLAEHIAAVDPRLAVYEQDDTTPKSYRSESVIAALVGATHVLQWQIVVLALWLAGLTGIVMRRGRA